MRPGCAADEILCNSCFDTVFSFFVCCAVIHGATFGGRRCHFNGVAQIFPRYGHGGKIHRLLGGRDVDHLNNFFIVLSFIFGATGPDITLNAGCVQCAQSNGKGESKKSETKRRTGPFVRGIFGDANRVQNDFSHV